MAQVRSVRLSGGWSERRSWFFGGHRLLGCGLIEPRSLCCQAWQFSCEC